mmetsp:Transcript_20381/g.40729  ORF Transcript_20381/g.40729 Transcript_20381/m.40729 type:complete len:275 (+) Transcript_20381:195-1019(+)
MSTARRILLGAAARAPRLRTACLSSIASEPASSPPSVAGNPMCILRDQSQRHRLCDTDGRRCPGKHWELQVSVNTSGGGDAEPPVLRTVNMQRISPLGVDFIMKHGKRSSQIAINPIAMCITSGSYTPGDTVEQWRAEGRCVPLPLSEVIDTAPSSTVAQMIACTRAASESSATEADVGWRKICSHDRLVISRKSHFVEMVQEARLELQNGEVPEEELEASVQAFRFQPERLEFMTGGPDQVIWDRWEWLRPASKDTDEDGSLAWEEPRHLLPY